jgi:hypothetical protein
MAFHAVVMDLSRPLTGMCYNSSSVPTYFELVAAVVCITLCEAIGAAQFWKLPFMAFYLGMKMSRSLTSRFA